MSLFCSPSQVTVILQVGKWKVKLSDYFTLTLTFVHLVEDLRCRARRGFLNTFPGRWGSGLYPWAHSLRVFVFILAGSRHGLWG